MEGGRYPARKTCTMQYGYFTSLEKAKQGFPLNGGLYTKEVLFFIVTEINFDQGDIDWINFNSVRIYNPEGKLVDYIDCDAEKTYHGRPSVRIKFHIGDIVDVFDYFENKTKLGIVAKLPYTEEEVAKFHRDNDGIKLTMDNDKYVICFLDNGYKQVTAVFVMTPFKESNEGALAKTKSKVGAIPKEQK